MKLHTFSIVTASLALLITSCAPTTPALGGSGYIFRPKQIVLSARETIADGYWDMPSGLSGDHVIVVDTQLQQAKYYVGGRQVGMSTISSGKAGHGTPRGEFRILKKDKDHKSSTYGSIVDSKGRVLVQDYSAGQSIPKGGIYKGAEMNFGLQLTRDGIWMHEGIVTAAPESHGCIRLPRKMAEIFFTHASVGTKVIIQ